MAGRTRLGVTGPMAAYGGFIAKEESPGGGLRLRTSMGMGLSVALGIRLAQQGLLGGLAFLVRAPVGRVNPPPHAAGPDAILQRSQSGPLSQGVGMLRTLQGLVVVLLLLLLTTPSHAQSASNCDRTATATGVATTAAAVTVTLTPNVDQYVYICAIHIVEVANAAVTGAAGPAPLFTTTNLATNLVWWGDNATQGTGFHKIIVDKVFPIPLRTATRGTAFTIVTSAGQSTQSVRLNLVGFFAR